MIVSHKHRFIFFKTRKTAGTSIELALEPLCGAADIIAATKDGVRGRNNRVPLHLRPFAWWWRTKRDVCPFRKHQQSPFATYYSHDRAELIRKLVGRKVFDSYFKFTIERNPWDREVSLYYWRTRRRPETKFRDFVLYNQQKFWVDNFNIYTIDGELVADYVMRYETLEDDLRVVSRLIGCDPAALSIPHAKPRRVERANYQSFYDLELRNIIAERHQREINLFNYRFD